MIKRYYKESKNKFFTDEEENKIIDIVSDFFGYGGGYNRKVKSDGSYQNVNNSILILDMSFDEENFGISEDPEVLNPDLTNKELNDKSNIKLKKKIEIVGDIIDNLLVELNTSNLPYGFELVNIEYMKKYKFEIYLKINKK